MATNRKPNPDAVVPVSLRLTREQHLRIKALAASQERTVSQEMRFAIDRHLTDADSRAA